MGMYWKHEGVDGDATQKGFQGFSNVHQFSWEMKRSFAGDQTGRAHNREGAQAFVGRVTLTKEVDHASGQIMKTACTEHRGKASEIAFVRTGDPGDPYLKFTLKNTLLQNLKVMGQGRDAQRPVEQIVLDFTDVEINAVVLGEDNTSEQPITVTYSIGSGTGG